MESSTQWIGAKNFSQERELLVELLKEGGITHQTLVQRLDTYCQDIWRRMQHLECWSNSSPATTKDSPANAQVCGTP